MALADRTGADRSVIAAFAVLHDALRVGDDVDPPHGARGGELARSIGLEILGLNAEQIALVEHACRGHTGGGISDDPTIGTCWDADRLTLWRVGLEPAVLYMSTDAGREHAASGVRLQSARDWEEIYVSVARGASSRPVLGG